MNKKLELGLYIGIPTILLSVGGYFAYKKWIEKKVWEFEDNTFTSSGQSDTNLGFIGTIEPPFKVGDTVYIKQDGGAKYSEYDGETIIQYIGQRLNKKWVVDVSKVRKGDTPVNSGFISNKKFN